eukprot:7381713-Prymnesium_polylepis.2
MSPSSACVGSSCANERPRASVMRRSSTSTCLRARKDWKVSPPESSNCMTSCVSVQLVSSKGMRAKMELSINRRLSCACDSKPVDEYEPVSMVPAWMYRASSVESDAGAVEVSVLMAPGCESELAAAAVERIGLAPKMT